jgi:hypothetical protein
MDVLTTRTLGYTDPTGTAREVVVTVFVPYEIGEAYWRCKYLFSPPFDRENVDMAGADFLQALLLCLAIVPHALRLELRTRAHWQGMRDCGLPRSAENPEGEQPPSYQPPDIPPPEPNPGDLRILSTRRLGLPAEHGVERALLLTIFKPIQAESETWKCAFAFGPTEGAQVRYGIGADFIEALLDALALARVVYEAMVPERSVAPGREELLDCADFPYKIGRSYWTDLRGDPA